MTKRWVQAAIAMTATVSLSLSGAGTARADAVQSLVDSAAADAAARGTTAGIAMLDRWTGRYTDNGGTAHLRFGSASVVKLFIADSVLRRASLGQIGLSAADRNAMGLMLRSSDDAAASNFWSRFGSSGIVTDVVNRYRLTETAPPANPRYWGQTQITAHDMVLFYAGMLSGAGGLSAADRDWIVAQLRAATPRGTDGVYQWFGLHDGLPRESVVGIKQGWMCCFSDGFIWRHTTGLVGPEARYVVVVLTRDPGSAGSAHTETSATRVVQRAFPAGLIPRVQGAIGDLWYRLGGHTGRLGLPVGDEGAVGDGRGAGQAFERGAVHWSPATGAHALFGGNLDAWRRQGAATGRLGYPTTDEVPLPDGAFNWFERGAVYWSEPTGSHAMLGGILDSWTRQGFERGRLGYPVTDEVPLADGAFTWFQNGAIYWSEATGAHWMNGPILDAWVRQGYERGPLGYPVGDVVTLADGAFSWYQNGALYWSPTTGAHWMNGPILDAWVREGYERGPLGYPISDPHAVAGGGTRVDFQHGSLTLSATGAVGRSTTPTPAAGAAAGALATPTPPASETPAEPSGGAAPTVTVPDTGTGATGGEQGGTP
jgi:hypothetical protein